MLYPTVVYCCQFDHSIVVSGGGDETVRIWDTSTGMCKHTLYGHKGEVVSKIMANSQGENLINTKNK